MFVCQIDFAMLDHFGEAKLNGFLIAHSLCMWETISTRNRKKMWTFYQFIWNVKKKKSVVKSVKEEMKREKEKSVSFSKVVSVEIHHIYAVR